jgi:hypothetical protein
MHQILAAWTGTKEMTCRGLENIMDGGNEVEFPVAGNLAVGWECDYVPGALARGGRCESVEQFFDRGMKLIVDR